MLRSKIKMAHSRNKSHNPSQFSLVKNTCYSVYVYYNSLHKYIHTAYSYIPSSSQIRRLKILGKKIAVIKLGNLPEYITEDKEIKILEIEKVVLFP